MDVLGFGGFFFRSKENKKNCNKVDCIWNICWKYRCVNCQKSYICIFKLSHSSVNICMAYIMLAKEITKPDDVFE